MEKYYFFVIILCLSTSTKAQDWTKKDSIWLQRVLSGKEPIQLNEDTKKAIESGTLLSPDPQIQEQMKISPAEWPITKTFEGITTLENRKKQPHELPPGVYKLYGLDATDSLPDATRSMTLYGKTVLELNVLDTLTPQKVIIGDNNDKLLRIMTIHFSAEDALRTIFWPSQRAKNRNKKNANAWKTYNNGY